MYTNVCRQGKFIAFRGYDKKWNRVEFKEPYRPSLFVSSNKPSQYKDINGFSVEPIEFESMWEAKEYLDEWKGVAGFDLHGQDNWTTQYLSDRFIDLSPNIPFEKLQTAYIDIETECEHSFPDVENPREIINAVTIRTNDVTYVLGVGKFKIPEEKDGRHYHQVSFEREADLLQYFIEIMGHISPDIITGWNCVPINSSIWGEKEIININQAQKSTSLFMSMVKNVSPVSSKRVVTQYLANGFKIESSEDHIFPYRLCPKEKYTKLQLGGKSHTYEENLSVKECENIKNKEKFVYIHTRNNKNKKTLEISNDQCYLLGLIYTDGSLKNKENIKHGFTIYQSDYDFPNRS